MLNDIIIDEKIPPLTDQGKERAKALADTLYAAGITAIITSHWERAKDTAQPLANLLKITPQVVPKTDRHQVYFEATANALRRLKDDTVLIVGHITVRRRRGHFHSLQNTA